MPRPRPLPLLVLAALLLAGCSMPGGDELPPVSFTDVHGLAVHPDDPDVVFVATHHGLFRGGKGGFERVGESRDDLMGFTMHPNDSSVAWSSGHPAPGSGASGPNLGLRKSTDGGKTWTALALPGVDFHLLVASPKDPSLLWGQSAGVLQRSRDGGATWEQVSQNSSLVAMAGSPHVADRLYGSTGKGLLRSEDGGRTWLGMSGQNIAFRGIAVSPNGTMLFAATGGDVRRSFDGGGSWGPTALKSEKGDLSFVAVSRSRPDTVYAATYAGAVFRSDDAAVTWAEVKGPG